MVRNCAPEKSRDSGSGPSDHPGMPGAKASAFGCRDYSFRLAAAKIKSATCSGCETRDRWPASSSTVVAFMRLARNRSRSGLMVWSSFDTAYQDGFECQAAAVVRPAKIDAAVDPCSAYRTSALLWSTPFAK